MQACFHNEAVFHAGSAIGALHEYVIKQSSRGGPADEIGFAFALRQCNKSINLLTASAEEQSGTYADLSIALITCVLFSIFEALIGHPTQAIVHALQGRKLLQNCERLAAAGQGSALVDTTSMLPVVVGLEIQAKSLQGKYMMRSDTSVDPPLPEVSRLHSLQHANWTLHFIHTKLMLFCQDTRLDTTPYEHAMRVAEKRQLFSAFLKTWEAAFADYLYREASALSTHDMHRAKVLKANHIAITMLTNLEHHSQAGYEPFKNECRAIIDLSASVLNTYTLVPGTTLNTLQFPFLTFGLWVSEPLFIVMSRCPDPELRRQAAGLLNGQPRASQRASSPHRKSHSCLGPTGTEAWNTNEWIQFTEGVRLDAGMATYFGRLPSQYIDKPQYPINSTRRS